jgi:hypothetical protein
MHAKEAHDGTRPLTPMRLDDWRVERVAFDSPGPPERMSDAPPALISILAAMVTEAVAYERREEEAHGTEEESPHTDS